MRKCLLLISILCLIALGTSAMAVDMDEGWLTDYMLNYYDHLQFRIATPGAAFRATGLSDFYYGTAWQQTENNGKYLFADGDDVMEMGYVYHFSHSGLPLTLCMEAYNNEALVRGDIWSWNGSIWNNLVSYTNAESIQDANLSKMAMGRYLDEVPVEIPDPAVPEPMSIALGVMGLGSVAGFARLRRK